MDAFVGYQKDTPASMILHATQMAGQPTDSEEDTYEDRVR